MAYPWRAERRGTAPAWIGFVIGIAYIVAIGFLARAIFASDAAPAPTPSARSTRP